MQAKDLNQFLDQVQETHVNLHIMSLMILKVPLDVNASPDFFRFLELTSRSVGIVEQIKHIPYDLQYYKLRLPIDVCARFNLNVRNLWDRINGIPKDELKDAVLE